jgi:hypothetical protein
MRKEHKMKKTIIILIVLAVAKMAFADGFWLDHKMVFQQWVMSLDMAIDRSASFNCDTSIKFKKEVTTIDMYFNGSLYRNYIEFDDKNRETLLAVVSKYKEWTELAKENGVTDLNKTIDTTTARIGWCYINNTNEWYSDMSVTVRYQFILTESGLPFIAVYFGEAKASSNEYCTNNIDPFLLFEEQILLLEIIMKDENIEEFKQKNLEAKSTDDMFQ